MTNFSISYSFGWIFVCLLVGAGYAWVQYAKSAPWSKALNRILAVGRAVLVSAICFLLLEPFLRTITNYFEKPLMVIAVDDSQSIVQGRTAVDAKGVIKDISDIIKPLEERGYETEIVTLNGATVQDPDSIQFTGSTTDLSRQLNSIKSSYSDYNLSGIVLFSDGIFNEGFSPLAIPNLPPVFTIGLGDTSSIKDISIKEVIHNSTVYEGNTLQLEVQVLNTGMGQVSGTVHVFSKNNEVASERINFAPRQTLVKALIPVPIKGSGKQSLKIVVEPLPGEYTELNNTTSVYFDVINARKRILLLASAPHPDLKAIKTSIEKNEYYEVELAYKLPSKLDYELLILHEYPGSLTSRTEKETLTQSKIPKWFIVGSGSDLNYLVSGMKLLKNTSSGSQMDQVRPVWNTNFDAFTFDDAFLEWVSDLPPITVRYGLESNPSLNQVLLYRQIGNVVVKNPLLFFTSYNNVKIGVLPGTGIWRWKLDEFRKEQSQKNFDELISKTVQYLSSDATKRRFYVTTTKNEYDQGEEVRFLTEQYNALFERTTGNKVTLRLTDEYGKNSGYSYVPLSESSQYTVSNLKEGIYNFVATTQMDSVKYTSSGQFAIRELNKESLNPVADHLLLERLAQKTGGTFHSATEIEKFIGQIEEFNPVSTIHSSDSEKFLTNIKWMLVLLLLLVSTEWFLRKFYGGY